MVSADGVCGAMLPPLPEEAELGATVDVCGGCKAMSDALGPGASDCGAWGKRFAGR
jgi:hypothetical protein